MINYYYYYYFIFIYIVIIINKDKLIGKSLLTNYKFILNIKAFPTKAPLSKYNAFLYDQSTNFSIYDTLDILDIT